MNNARSFLTFFLVLCLFTYSKAQNNNSYYIKAWNKVDSLNRVNLPQSALKEIEKIYQTARKESNEGQLIKALICQTNLTNTVQEDGTVENIQFLEKEIPNVPQPARSVAYTLLATKYWQFFQQQRWYIYNRTNTDGLKKDDLNTWTASDFHAKTSELYLASLKEEAILQQTPVEKFDVIISTYHAPSRHLRPTLFDLLAHQALLYFNNDERDVIKPAYSFTIHDEKAFTPAVQFQSHRFITQDTSALQYKALLIYQKLTAFHLKDNSPEAVFDITIQRLDWARRNSTLENKDELYRQALEYLAQQYSAHFVSDQANYLLARYYADKAAGYNPLQLSNDKDNLKTAYLTAERICREVLKRPKNPDSNGQQNARSLLNEIVRKEIQLTLEKVNIPDQTFRTLVSYRNIGSTSFRLIKVTESFKKGLDKIRTNYGIDDREFWEYFIKQKPIRSWDQSLPVVNDHHWHKTEVKVEGLPAGEYALLTCSDPKFQLIDKDDDEFPSPLAVHFFYVSGISYIQNEKDLFVLDRETGRPLAQATVEVWKEKYNYSKRRNDYVQTGILYTDANGGCKITPPKDGGRLQFRISYQNDYLALEDEQYLYYYSYANRKPLTESEYESQKRQVFLFTDRSIYRPGQTVYFKGIITTRDYQTKKQKVIPDYSTSVYLYDVNSQQIASISLKTNEFGSFNGKFELPMNVLTGQFRLYASGSQQSISVEEYKRPKFYVELDTIKGAYQLNDTVSVSGNAKAYAGNGMDGAKVKYRIVRKPYFPYPWLCWGWKLPAYAETEITNGELTTNDDGKFTVRFTALPDLKISKKWQPAFYYTVHVDVTDMNGETRSEEKVIPIGYTSLQLSIQIPEGSIIAADSLKHLIVRSQNLSGAFEKVNASLNIYKLKSPNRLIRERYWEQPDQFIYSQEEYIKLFPNDEYKNESDYHTWEKEKAVFQQAFQISENGKINLNNLKAHEGWYAVEVTAKDKQDNEVKTVEYFQLYNPDTKELPAPAYMWNKDLKNGILAGEKAVFLTGTSAKDVFLIERQSKKGKDGIYDIYGEKQYRFSRLDYEKKELVYPTDATDDGGFDINYAFIKNNRLYTFSNYIAIRWPQYQLDVTYGTYRDKVEPGSKEKWTVKVNSYQNQKKAAEMLATLYDASLDQFKPHSWNALSLQLFHPMYSYNSQWNAWGNFTQSRGDVIPQRINNWYSNPNYDRLNLEECGGSYYNFSSAPSGRVSGITIRGAASKSLSEVVVVGYGNKQRIKDGEDKKEMADAIEEEAPEAAKAAAPLEPSAENQTNQAEGRGINTKEIQIRKNFQETAFFYPDLKTDSLGNIEFNFTVPETLTRWKLMTLAYTQEAASGYNAATIVTQKKLMVQPNAPRFLREGDKMEFSAKLSNLTNATLNGKVQLQLFDAATMKPVDSLFKNIRSIQAFIVAAQKSAPAKFTIEIPYNFNQAVVYRIVAASNTYSDGEEAALPVLSNRMLVTETLPLPMSGKGTKSFRFEKLATSSSKSLANHALTVEYTSNPAWYAIQALPYLMEYPYECAEQTFNRYYANSLASAIVNASPKVKAVFERWQKADTAALMSNLQKNEELKSILLAETPWVLQAKSETQRKKNVALLFDLVRMNSELNRALNKLVKLQTSNGGFAWFSGGRDDRYITQYIVSGIGHLQKLGGFSHTNDYKLNSLLQSAIRYADERLKDDYDELIRHRKKHNIPLDKDEGLDDIQVQYLYMRSFFPENPIAEQYQKAYNYYRKQAQLTWTEKSKYMQGMMALALHRAGDVATAKAIVASLKENAIVKEELGMYWKEISYGYYWYQAPVETQSLLIESFMEITQDENAVNAMRTWLLKQKQTQAWSNTKATAEACYALLIKPSAQISNNKTQLSDWVTEENEVTIQLGNQTLKSNEQKAESGTGYFKKRIEGENIKPEMGNITVSTTGNTPSWGAVYWQYFEDLDKITPAATPLQLNKKLFIERNTDRGPVLTEIKAGSKVKVGDKIKVRIELRVDRAMEYVHMKDMRASGMEPVNVLSQYKWQDGLGYYESTKDASTNFFFSWLPKGTYVFEYPLFVTHAGNFSNGITSIQCMYAPEFTSHSEGIRITVE